MNSRLFRPLALVVSAALTIIIACNELNVMAVDVAEVQVIPDTAMLTVGGTRQLNANLRDASGNLLAGRNVQWSTSDAARVQIETDGRIVGVSPGTAVITATSGSVKGDANVTVVPAITIVVDSARVTMAGAEGGTTPIVRTTGVRVQSGNAAAGLRATVTYSAGQATGWLEVSLLDATTPTTLRLTGSVGALRQGTYQATVTVESSTPGAQPVAIAVEFRISTGPTIGVASATASFTAAQGASDPPTQNIAVTNSGGGTLSGLGASITYTAGQPAGWLVASLSPSTAPSNLTLNARTGTLASGTYTATVLVIASGASNSPQSVTVTFTITAARPTIQLGESSLVFSAIAGGPNPGLHAITVTNSGGGTLSGLTASVVYAPGQTGDWLTPTLSTTTAPATLTLQPRTGTLAAGRYNATVSVASAVATNSPQDISVILDVTPPSAGPTIALSTDTATFTAVVGGANPASRAVQVTNSGGGSLTGLLTNVVYAQGQPAGWLGATLSTTTAPATLTLQPTTGTLPVGTYAATAQVISPVASNSPRALTVTFIVTVATAPPAIGLNPTSVAFNATAGGGNPAASTVAVQNTGSGALDDLTIAGPAYTSGQPTGWLTAALTGTTAPTQLSLQATTGTLAAATYTATVQVRSAKSSNSPQTVSVTFTVTAPPPQPAIGLNPTSISFSATAGGANPAASTVSVQNTASGTLDDLTIGGPAYISGQPTGWLSAALAGTHGADAADASGDDGYTRGRCLYRHRTGTVGESEQQPTNRVGDVHRRSASTAAGDRSESHQRHVQRDGGRRQPGREHSGCSEHRVRRSG